MSSQLDLALDIFRKSPYAKKENISRREGGQYDQNDSSGYDGILGTMLGEDYTQETLETYNVCQHITADYPPCYLVCGRDDTTVPSRNSELMKECLDENKVPCVLEEGEHASHGFGDGTGTDVEGWPQRAIDFLESL